MLEWRPVRRRGRVVEGTPLLREHAAYTRIEGSNPSVSAKFWQLRPCFYRAFSFLPASHCGITAESGEFAPSAPQFVSHLVESTSAEIQSQETSTRCVQWIATGSFRSRSSVPVLSFFVVLSFFRSSGESRCGELIRNVCIRTQAALA